MKELFEKIYNGLKKDKIGDIYKSLKIVKDEQMEQLQNEINHYQNWVKEEKTLENQSQVEQILQTSKKTLNVLQDFSNFVEKEMEKKSDYLELDWEKMFSTSWIGTHKDYPKNRYHIAQSEGKYEVSFSGITTKEYDSFELAKEFATEHFNETIEKS